MLDCVDKLLFGQICTSSYPLKKKTAISFWHDLLCVSVIGMHSYFLQRVFKTATKFIFLLFSLEVALIVLNTCCAIHLKQHYNFTLKCFIISNNSLKVNMSFSNYFQRQLSLYFFQFQEHDANVVALLVGGLIGLSESGSYVLWLS